MKYIMLHMIGWLAEHFPNHFFYSSRFLNEMNWAFGTKDDADVHQTQTGTVLLGISVAAQRNGLQVGGKMIAEFTGVTNRGSEIGNFRVTVERLK